MQSIYLRKHELSTIPCDDYIADMSKLETKYIDRKPLAASTLWISFNEPISMNKYSNQIQTRNQNLSLKLSSNLDEQKSVYIDIIDFKLSHLLHYSSNEKNTPICESNKYIIELEAAILPIFGQFVRFYLLFIPCFLVVIIQFYDFLSILLEICNQQAAINTHDYFILHKLKCYFNYHLIFSVSISCLTYFVSFTSLGDDYGFLRKEKTYQVLASFILYWFAYAIISIACMFLSIILNVLSFIMHRVIFRLAPFISSNEIFQRIVAFLHLLITLGCSYFAFALTHCSLFYGEIVRLASINPIYTIDNIPRVHFLYLFYLIRKIKLFLILIDELFKIL